MNETLQWVAAVMALIGSGFVLLASIGVVRYPDAYMRMQALTKASTLGLGLILLGAAMARPTATNWSHALLTIVFLFLTQPIAAHALSRAAYRTGTPLWHGAKSDRYGEYLNSKSEGNAPEDPEQQP